MRGRARARGAPPPATPEASFHAAGAEYADAREDVASNLVARALARFPGDRELLALKTLLERPPEQEPREQEQPPEPQEPEPSPGGGEPGEAPPPDTPPPGGDEPPPQGGGERPAQERDASGDGTARPGDAQEMTPEEARMLLDAMREEEAARREGMRLRLGAPVPVEKDW